jgi:hypothetical protein
MFFLFQVSTLLLWQSVIHIFIMFTNHHLSSLLLAFYSPASSSYYPPPVLLFASVIFRHLHWNKFYCQAQPQLQVKLSLKAEFALVSIIPATHPPPPPPTHPPVKVYLATDFNRIEAKLQSLTKWKYPS